jgi:hypothetical protein
MPHCIPSLSKQPSTPPRFLTALPRFTFYIDCRESGAECGYLGEYFLRILQPTHEDTRPIILKTNCLRLK